ncbi:MAG TPA: CdaR family protein [Myxococcota bacterium]|nr:CdaR family protein [Myxococcota bacterium]HNH48926.1 CdaR family protein [Myxococcota bacterium]
MSLRDDLRAAFTQNLGYKLASGVFALGIWIWVQNEQVITDRTRVHLEWQLPEGLVATEPLLEQVALTTEGVQALVRATRSQDLRITLDLRRAKIGDVTVDLADQIITGLPTGLRVVSLSPSTLRVQLDRILKKKVAVRIAETGDIANGYRLQGLKVQPNNIELIGPSSLLRSVSEVSTDPVDLSGLRDDMSLDVALDLKPGIRSAAARTVQVKVDVEELRDVRVLEAVPVLLQDGGRYVAGISSVRLKIEGPTALLAELDVDKVVVRVVVPADYDGRTGEVARGTEGLHYTVELPDSDRYEVEVDPPRIPLLPKGGG